MNLPVLPLEQAQRAHEMLAGAPHKKRKIVLTMHGVHQILRLRSEKAPGAPGSA